MPVILIVNDEGPFRKQLRNVFDLGSGFDACIEARSGSEAFAESCRQPPDLAILDFSLPDMSGLQLAEELKAIKPELSVFLLTEAYSAKFEKKALTCGITAVFSKLEDLTTLLANARATCGIE